MRERGDLQCLHEPFMYYYYVARKVREFPHFDRDPSQPVDYRDIRNDILVNAKSGPVFFKDMSFYALEEMMEDSDFSQRLNHTFLIRNPRDAIASYYELDPDITLEEIGIESQWIHFEYLERLTGSAPLVVEAEAIRTDPKTVLRRVWEWQGLGYIEDAFNWGESKVPKDWRQVEGWHGSVLNSGGIETQAPNSADSRDIRFDRCCESAPHLQDFLDHHLPYYQALRDRALRL